MSQDRRPPRIRRGRRGAAGTETFVRVVLVICVLVPFVVLGSGVIGRSETVDRRRMALGIARAALEHARYRIANNGQAPYRVLEGPASPAPGPDERALFESLASPDKRVATDNDLERSPVFAHFGHPRAGGRRAGITPENKEVYESVSGTTCQVVVRTEGLDADVDGTDDLDLAQIEVTVVWSEPGGSREVKMASVVGRRGGVVP